MSEYSLAFMKRVKLLYKTNLLRKFGEQLKCYDVLPFDKLIFIHEKIIIVI